MKRGPKPKPTATHKLNGNPSRLNLAEREANEPKPEKPAGENDLPRAPKYFSKIARKEWQRIVPLLFRADLLTKVDTAALEGYCQAYNDMVKSAKFLNSLGDDKQPVWQTSNGAYVQFPQVSMFNKSARLVAAFCAEFGLTPSSRGRMGIEGDEKDDDMDDIIDGKPGKAPAAVAGRIKGLKKIKDDKK
jgi:P27 family predicted phage terminase small subunit